MLKDAKESYEAVGLEVHLELAHQADLACSECQPPQPSDTVEGWYVTTLAPSPKGSAPPAGTRTFGSEGDLSRKPGRDGFQAIPSINKITNIVV